MTALGSLIGFLLVFLLVSWGLSAPGYLLLRLGESQARQAGCGVERSLAAIALAAPPLLGGAVMVVLMAHSLAALRNGKGDHCLQHLHHPHLCLLHGAGWAHERWAVLMVAGVLLFGLVEAVRHGRAALRAVRSLRELESSAQEHAGPGIPLLRIKSDTPFCMVAGIRRPRVFISSGAERLLNESEHQAVLAHEAAHAQQGDQWKRSLFAACTLLGAPGLSGRIFARWNSATERLCDHQAALCSGDASAVASALVRLVRAQSTTLATTASFCSADQIDERVHALLNGQPIGAAQSQRVLRVAVAVSGAALLLCAACSDPLHHFFESFLALM